MLTARLDLVKTHAKTLLQVKSKFKDDTNDDNKFKIDILDTIAELESVKQMIEVQDNVATCKMSHIDAVEKLGKNCHYPGSFQGKHV